ncbi:MAG TPA: nucleotide sugar dehydrogenase [Xanthomonadaceae bacterium]|nr:nucleotide sugar dehydrogenase [Xanthomonadaceae bacterium]HRY01321.1 nucleotide sugar dehydrogenase [Xanthomonadaceae bacterium]
MEVASLPRETDIRLAIVGLGYVGLPLALAFSREVDTLGFDIDAGRVEELGRGEDVTGELDETERSELSRIRFSDDVESLSERNVFIVAVPTPVDRHKYPDMSALEGATKTVAGHISRGDVVIFESTVYPGATEEVCVPLLEAGSGLRCNVDFHVGYSPERINPGDRTHRLADIVKVTSGSNPAAADFIDALYRKVVRAGTHRAPDLRTAEAAKAIENTQRDVNIALMNELAQMFARLGLDTQAVLDAAGSKWNFLPFRPGLVGGHCIGVDPYYLIHKAQEAGHFPELIMAARRINDGMATYVGDRFLRLLAKRRVNVVGARVLVLGLTFKENCPDLRNSQVAHLVERLRRYHAEVDALDPWVDADEAAEHVGIRPISGPESGTYDAILLAVAHRQFAELGGEGIRAWLKPGGVLFDIKHLLPREASDERL